MEGGGLQRSPFTHAGEGPVIEMRELEGRPLPIAAPIRELLWGDRAVLVEMSAPAGFDAEPHAHDHESLVYIVSGRVRATVGDETRELGAGDAVLHATGVAHHIEALVDTRWIEIKIPPRATWPTRGPDA
jgi:quercetin dioxygenase-like cupin family protein